MWGNSVSFTVIKMSLGVSTLLSFLFLSFFFKEKNLSPSLFLSCTIETCCITSIPKTCESLGTMLASVSRLQQMHNNFLFFNLVKIHLKPSIWKGCLESVAQISDDKFKVVGNTSVKRQTVVCRLSSNMLRFKMNGSKSWQWCRIHQDM